MSSYKYQISIIMPFYNVEFDLIKNAINSVINQTMLSFEIVIIDDGSNEELSSMVESYIYKLHDVRMYKQKNKGVSAARNYGISVALGEYIVFLDADDRFTEYFFSDLSRIIIQKPDIILGGTKMVLYDYVPCKFLDGDTKMFCNTDDLTTWKSRLYGRHYFFSESDKIYLNVGVAAKAVRSEIAKKIPVNEKVKIAEDCLWNQQVMQYVKSLYVCNRLWYLYTYNPSSATHRYNTDIIQETYDALTFARQYMNLNDQKEERAYVDRTINLIVVISDLYINHPNSNLTFKERVLLEKRIYSQEPWSYLRNYHQKDRYNRRVLILYKTHLLFEYLRIKKFIKG